MSTVSRDLNRKIPNEDAEPTKITNTRGKERPIAYVTQAEPVSGVVASYMTEDPDLNVFILGMRLFWSDLPGGLIEILTNDEIGMSA